MLIEITHENVFEYEGPVSESYLEFRMTPLTDAMQHLLQHRARVTPPGPVRQYVDAWGNTVSYVNVLEPLTRLEVSCDSVVETFAARNREPAIPRQDRSSPTVRLMLHDYLQPTPLTGWSEEFREYVRPFERFRGAPAREAAEAVREAIHRDFQYQGEVTSSSSPITEALRHRAGVCQDFAHLMLAACRHLGFPARYVSGYVLPEQGQEAASHAWCQVFDPEQGWFGADPTYNLWVDERYVRLGIGRDYRDVPPNRGVFRGSKSEHLQVRVQLRPITADEVEARARALYMQPRGGMGRAVA
jgi:transglutaminase-like putative cysteine protease